MHIRWPALLFSCAALLGSACRSPEPAPTASAEADSRESQADVASRLHDMRAASAPSQPAAKPGFHVEWSPTLGKGAISQVIEGDGTYRICLGCLYPGYSGGLWIGSMRASGFEWRPERPIPGFGGLNLFCAQDETIVDLATKAEYEPGWSQNFGRGDDGVTLAYLRGDIVQDGTQGRDLLLRSVNAAGCYRQTRYLLWPRGKPFVVVSLYIENVCDYPISFDFWTGDDPWIGRYETSEGDVGWTPDGIVRSEAVLDPTKFRTAGFYDLGNDLLGESAARFSNVANFMTLDPSTAVPTHAFFANRFAHDPGEIDPKKPLDNQSITALNIGWKGVSLKPGQQWRLAYAMGRADTQRPEELPGQGTQAKIPSAPALDPALWHFDQAVHAAEDQAWGAKKKKSGVEAPMQFREETIHVTVNPPDMTVDALYIFENHSEIALNMGMYYPFPLEPELAYPHQVDVKGARFKRTPTGLLWKLSLTPHGAATVEVKYTQRCLGALARYILTSTAFWNRSLEKGHYRVDWPSTLPNVSVSYPGTRRSEGGREFLEWEANDFMPTKDIVVTW